MANNHELEPTRLSTKPTWLITQTSIEAQRLLSDALAGVGARGYHYRLLAALDEFGPASQATLGRRTAMDRSDVVAALNELAATSFIERGSDPRDARRNVITLTAAGRDRLEQLEGLIAEVQEHLLRPLSDRERSTLIRMLTLVLQHHDARGARLAGDAPGVIPGAPWLRPSPTRTPRPRRDPTIA